MKKALTFFFLILFARLSFAGSEIFLCANLNSEWKLDKKIEGFNNDETYLYKSNYAIASIFLKKEIYSKESFDFHIRYLTEASFNLMPSRPELLMGLRHIRYKGSATTDLHPNLYGFGAYIWCDDVKLDVLVTLAQGLSPETIKKGEKAYNDLVLSFAQQLSGKVWPSYECKNKIQFKR